MGKATLPAKQEAFCKGIADGMSGADAYLWAGYKSTPRAAAVSANRLLKNAAIVARVQQLLSKKQQIEQKATEIAAEKLAITKEKVLAELAKIGFSDIRRAVKWHGHLVQETDQPEGGDVLVVKNTYSNHVSLIGSEEIDDDTAAAIAEISQSPTGGLKVKLHDKKGALVDIGKHLGMFKEVHEHTGKDGGPIDARHHHQVDPVSVFDAFITEAVGGRAESDTEDSVPN